MMKLTTYDRYKDSGIEWLGEVPELWDRFSIQNIAESNNRYSLTGGPFGSDLKSDEYTEDGIRIIQLQNIGVGYFNNKYKIYTTEEKANQLYSCNIFPNDIIIAKMADPVARACLIPDFHKRYLMASDGIRFVPNNLFDRRYLVYAINSKYFRSQAEVNSNGITRLRIGLTVFKKLSIYAPKKEEQVRIANYLDQATTKIDKKINLLTQKIKHYQDLKTALINRAVTKGLDDSVEMKDSGVEWIGEIPKHWQANALKRFYTNIGSGTTPTSGETKYYEGGTINWVVTGDLNDSVLKDNKYKITEEAFNNYSTLKIYPKGTLLIAMYGATIGKTAILDIEACTNQACCALQAGKKVMNEFMFFWFLAKKQHIINLSVGGGQPNISQGIIKNIIVTIPPKTEQQKIVEYLNKKTSTINKIIATITTQIEHQKELRKTLINDVVTGKVKVENS